MGIKLEKKSNIALFPVSTAHGMTTNHNFLTHLVLALRSYFEAFRFIRRHNLRIFYWTPLLFAVLILWAGLKGSSWATEKSIELLQNSLPLPVWPSWLQTISYAIIWVVFRILLWFIFSVLGGYFLLMTLSPVFTLLSHQTQKLLSENRQSIDFFDLMHHTLKGIAVAFRNLWIEILLGLGCFCLSMIPLLGTIAPVLLVWTTARLMGNSFHAYTPGNTIQPGGTGVGLGLPIALALAIPFAGIFMAAWLSIPAVVAAHLLAHNPTRNTI